MIQNCLNLDGHPNGITGSKVTVRGWILPIRSCVSKGLGLQPAGNSCMTLYSADFHTKFCKILISFVFRLKVVLKYLHSICLT